jgi:hypothetical protein
MTRNTSVPRKTGKETVAVDPLASPQCPTSMQFLRSPQLLQLVQTGGLELGAKLAQMASKTSMLLSAPLKGVPLTKKDGIITTPL